VVVGVAGGGGGGGRGAGRGRVGGDGGGGSACETGPFLKQAGIRLLLAQQHGLSCCLISFLSQHAMCTAFTQYSDTSANE